MGTSLVYAHLLICVFVATTSAAWPKQGQQSSPPYGMQPPIPGFLGQLVKEDNNKNGASTFRLPPPVVESDEDDDATPANVIQEQPKDLPSKQDYSQQSPRPGVTAATSVTSTTKPAGPPELPPLKLPSGYGKTDGVVPAASVPPSVPTVGTQQLPIPSQTVSATPTPWNQQASSQPSPRTGVTAATSVTATTRPTGLPETQKVGGPGSPSKLPSTEEVNAAFAALDELKREQYAKENSMTMPTSLAQPSPSVTPTSQPASPPAQRPFKFGLGMGMFQRPKPEQKPLTAPSVVPSPPAASPATSTPETLKPVASPSRFGWLPFPAKPATPSPAPIVSPDQKELLDLIAITHTTSRPINSFVQVGGVLQSLQPIPVQASVRTPPNVNNKDKIQLKRELDNMVKELNSLATQAKGLIGNLDFIPVEMLQQQMQKIKNVLKEFVLNLNAEPKPNQQRFSLFRFTANKS